jgi:hypothetical protein
VIVLWIAFRFVEAELSLRERSERQRESEEQRRQTREAVLKNVHAELESNASVLNTALGILGGGQPLLLFPLFDITLWPTVSSTGVFVSLNPETALALVDAYNRMGTANEQNATLLDMSQGPTAILIAMSAAPSLDEPHVKGVWARFQDLLDRRREELLDRLKDLKRHLDEAIDAVELELGLDLPNKAADRHYVTDEPQGP